ncbi:MAG: CapA family protein [Bacteroidales bacterium]|nr:CapA family protein [Bacteroidales bacterium]MDD4671175.1 CapA family protein [Bacteroidales bacterium]
MARFPTTLLTLFSSVLLFGQAADTTRIVFIGDVMAHTLQLNTALISECDSSLSDSYDFGTYFKYLQPQFDSADFVVANMEFPCGVTPFSGYPAFSAPYSLPIEAKKSGIDLFLTANNHICDKGIEGLDSTYNFYSSLGVNFTGLYKSEEDERKNNPLILTINDISVTFVNFTYGVNGVGRNIPEPYKVNLMDTLHVKEVIGRAKERGAELVVALPHWGEEYYLDYSQTQKEWRDFLYACGADVIIGTHPHVVQKTEYDGLHAIAYSLGNFISNMSIVYGQIGMVYEMRLIREEDNTISILPPHIRYVWCARGGKLEENYTVIPILDFIEKKDAFMVDAEYRKMKREWDAIVKKFKL